MGSNPPAPIFTWVLPPHHDYPFLGLSMTKRFLAGFKFLILLIVPALVLILSFLAKNSRDPYWGNPDPTYQYLFCSLHILNGITPSHTDHPGTTVQVLGALVLKLMHPFSSGQQIVQHVINDPEYHLYVMNSFFVFCHVIVLIFLGFFVYKKSGDIFLAVLLQAIPSLRFLGGVYEMTFMQPEIFHYTILNLYVVCLVKLYYDDAMSKLYKTAIFSGIVYGLGVATKVTMLPLFLAPLILLPRWREKLIYVTSACFSFFLATLPILPRYKDMYDWMHKILFQSGHARSMTKPIFSGQDFIGNLKALIPANDVLFRWAAWVIAALMIRYLFLMISHREEQLTRVKKAGWFLIVLIVVMALQVSMVAKYPARHYLIPTYGLTGVLIFFAFELFAFSKLRSLVIAFFLISVVVPEMGPRYKGYLDMKKGTQIAIQEKLAFHNHITYKYSQCYLIYASGCSHPLWALNWGDHWHTYMKFGNLLKEKYPGALFYDLWEREIHDFAQKGPVKQVYPALQKRSGCVLLQAGCSNYGHFAQVMDLEFKEKHDSECIYQIKGIKDSQDW